MTRDTPAEIILKRLGITDPREIDLEAIAWHLGVRVRYRPLDRCEARIIGCGDRAVITVNSHSGRRRRRFRSAMSSAIGITIVATCSSVQPRISAAQRPAA